MEILKSSLLKLNLNLELITDIVITLLLSLIGVMVIISSWYENFLTFSTSILGLVIYGCFVVDHKLSQITDPEEEHQNDPY